VAAGHRVVIVVGGGFADEVRRISAECHVWAVRTPEHEAAFSEHRPRSSAAWNERGITLFNGGGDSPEQELIDVFGTVYEHHGEYSHDPSLDEVEALGAAPSAEVREALAAYGFAHVAASRDGFVATRSR
jgi:hypothetical protein